MPAKTTTKTSTTFEGSDNSNIGETPERRKLWSGFVALTNHSVQLYSYGAETSEVISGDSWTETPAGRRQRLWAIIELSAVDSAAGKACSKVLPTLAEMMHSACGSSGWRSSRELLLNIDAKVSTLKWRLCFLCRARTCES